MIEVEKDARTQTDKAREKEAEARETDRARYRKLEKD